MSNLQEFALEVGKELAFSETGKTVIAGSAKVAGGITALGAGAALATSGVPGVTAVGIALANVGATATTTAAATASTLGATGLASGITSAGTAALTAGASLGPLLPIAAGGYAIYKLIKWLNE